MINRKGVTLVELSIVIVIIGLLVVGILVGADLIKQSELRKDIGAIENYRTASETFRLKYATLPGDLKTAQTYWPDCSDYGQLIPDYIFTCNGNGDGKWQLNEGYFAGFHLTKAGFISGTNNAPAAGSIPELAAIPTLKTTGHFLLPISIYTSGFGGTFFDYPVTDSLFFSITSDGNPGTSENQKKVDHNMVYDLDMKMDDGVGGSGNMRAQYPVSVIDEEDLCTDEDGLYRISEEGPFVCDFIMRY